MHLNAKQRAQALKQTLILLKAHGVTVVSSDTFTTAVVVSYGPFRGNIVAARDSEGFCKTRWWYDPERPEAEALAWSDATDRSIFGMMQRRSVPTTAKLLAALEDQLNWLRRYTEGEYQAPAQEARKVIAAHHSPKRCGGFGAGMNSRSFAG